MPNKRSKRKNTRRFFCPFCEERLWRLGTPKYYIFYKNAAEISKNTGITAKKAKLLATQNTTYLDPKKWIEGFCCSNHGNQWLLISIKENKHEYRLAAQKDWSRTGKTLDPTVSNPSVSEFTLKMSRKPH